MFALDYHPPYDWQWMFGFLAARAVSGIETVTPGRYCRSFALGLHQGLITLEPEEERHVLNVRLSDGLLPVADEVLRRVRRLLDLDCQPQPILERLGSLAKAHPGLRLPGCMDPFEQAIRAILGQLVSVAMAAKLAGKLTQHFGQAVEGFPDWQLFPRAGVLASIAPEQLKALGMPLKRGEAIVHLAQQVEAGTFPLLMPEEGELGVKRLIAFPGIGRWTASYFALRGWQARDVFLPDDYLIKQRFAGMTPAQIGRYAQRWQPWRSYALLHIWNSEGWKPETGTPDQLMAK